MIVYMYIGIDGFNDISKIWDICFYFGIKKKFWVLCENLIIVNF